MMYDKDATGYTLNYQRQKSTCYMIRWMIDKAASGDAFNYQRQEIAL